MVASRNVSAVRRQAITWTNHDLMCQLYTKNPMLVKSNQSFSSIEMYVEMTSPILFKPQSVDNPAYGHYQTHDIYVSGVIAKPELIILMQNIQY